METKSTYFITAASLLAELPTPLAVVCHDAGATNLILAWLKRSHRDDVRPVMQGPAADLWRKQFARTPVWDLEQAMDGAAALLSGTGWASDLEHRARALAKGKGIKSVAVVDHWINYAERFVRNSATVWPDTLWVTDADALAIARRIFPSTTVELKPNLYLKDQVSRIKPIRGVSRSRLLYVLEPARSDWGRGKPGEFQSLDFLADHLHILGLPRSTPLRLRPHPSDPPGKYDCWLAAHRQMGFDASLDNSCDLAAAISRADLVAGGQSFALIIALATERKVICTLPPWAPRCVLPHEGIIHLSCLIDSVADRSR